MTKNIIIANWKMNISFDEAQNWLENIDKKLRKVPQNLPEIVLCPPSIMIEYIDGFFMENEFEAIEKLQQNIDEIKEAEIEKLSDKIRLIKLGGQDCSFEDKGAFTGDISATMLKDAGAKYVILGHSERRQHYLESDQIIAKKIICAKKQNLVPILCVGESKEKRDQGDYQEFIINQLKNSLPKDIKIKDLVIAYEPIWSIGSGIIPTTKEIEEIATLITKKIKNNNNISNFKVVYGGSVGNNNSKEILAINNINGLLVGGASLKPEEFFKILSK